MMAVTLRPCAVNSAPGAIRTHDPRIRNPMLYPAELRGLRVGQEELTRVTDRPAILMLRTAPALALGGKKSVS